MGVHPGRKNSGIPWITLKGVVTNSGNKGRREGAFREGTYERNFLTTREDQRCLPGKKTDGVVGSGVQGRLSKSLLGGALKVHWRERGQLVTSRRRKMGEPEVGVFVRQ